MTDTPENAPRTDWFVSPDTPSTIITPHGRISIAWTSTDGEYNRRAEQTADLIVRAVAAQREQAREIEALRALLRKCRDALPKVPEGWQGEGYRRFVPHPLAAEIDALTGDKSHD